MQQVKFYISLFEIRRCRLHVLPSGMPGKNVLAPDYQLSDDHACTLAVTHTRPYNRNTVGVIDHSAGGIYHHPLWAALTSAIRSQVQQKPTHDFIPNCPIVFFLHLHQDLNTSESLPTYICSCGVTSLPEMTNKTNCDNFQVHALSSAFFG